MSGDGTVAWRYENPDWLCIHKVINHQCQKCAHPELDRPNAPAHTEMASLRQIKDKLDALLEAKEDTIRFRKMMVEENSMAWNQFMGAIDGLNAGIARELGELRRDLFISLAAAHAKLNTLIGPERRPAKPKRKRLACGKCHKSFKNCKCKVFAAQNPFPAKPPRKKAAKRKGKRQ